MALAEWSAVLLGGALLGTQLAAPDPRIGDDDFGVFYAGATAAAQGQSPYVGDFVSPPWFALALVPLTWLPVDVARGVWLAVNLALLLGVVALALRIVGLEWPVRRIALASVALGLWPPAEFGLRLGQSSLLVWAVLLGAILCTRGGRFAASGGLLALALVKPQLAWLYALGLGGWVWRRGRLGQFLAAGAAVLAVLAVAVALLAPASYADLAALRPRTWDYWGSTVALPPLLAILAGSQPLGLLLYLPLVVFGSVLLARQWAVEDDLAYVASLTACTTLLLTPYAYPYDAVLLVLPLLYLAGRSTDEASVKTLPKALVGAVLVVALLALERPADYTASRFLGLAPPLIIAVVLVGWRRRNRVIVS